MNLNYTQKEIINKLIYKGNVFLIPILSFTILLSNCTNHSIDDSKLAKSISDTSVVTNYENAYLSLPIVDIKQCWIVNSVPYEQNGGLYDEGEIQKLKGRKICFDTDSVILINDTLIGCTYSIKDADLGNIIKNKMNASVKELGLTYSIKGKEITLRGLNRKYAYPEGKESYQYKTFFYVKEGLMYYFDGNGTCFLLK